MRKTLGLSLVLVSGLILSGCESEPAEDATLELPADTMAAATTISLDDLAGTWDMRAVPETGGDTTATVYQLLVTADGATLMLPDRDPIEGQVTVAGDSLVMVAGPFESVRREGVMTTTNTVLRMEGDRLVGTTVATYETTDADDELRLATEGTRAP
jgi:hypothetical protein